MLVSSVWRDCMLVSSVWRDSMLVGSVWRDYMLVVGGGTSITSDSLFYGCGW